MNADEILVLLIAGSVGGGLISLSAWIFRVLWRREKILWALLKQLEVIPRTSQHNATASNSHHVVPVEYPVESFEVALFGFDGISLNQLSITAAVEYLVMARKLNAVIQVLQDAHFLTDPATAGARDATRQFLEDQAQKDMLAVIPPLQETLKLESRNATIHLAVAVAVALKAVTLVGIVLVFLFLRYLKVI